MRLNSSRDSSRVIYSCTSAGGGAGEGTVKDKERIYCSQNREFGLKINFLKVGSLFVLKDADHFKPKIFFSIFGQLSNYPIS